MTTEYARDRLNKAMLHLSDAMARLVDCEVNALQTKNPFMHIRVLVAKKMLEHAIDDARKIYSLERPP